MLKKLKHVTRSKMGWALASLHAVWFVAQIANMGPPDPKLAAEMEAGVQWAGTTLLAGRLFHFTYEAIGMKVLMLVDLPSMIAMIPVELAVSPFARWLEMSLFVRSYCDAGILLMGATVQWLLVG